MNTIFILKIYSFIRFNSCTTDVLIPSKTKCARGNVTYLWSCMIKHLKDNKAKCECATQPKKRKKLNSNHLLSLYRCMPLHKPNEQHL